MRIVSLLPAATEWLGAMGALDALVARSHACDFPPSIGGLPVVTKPVREDASTSPVTIARSDDADASPCLLEGCSRFDVDLTRLAALKPDLILAQDRCPTCTLSRAALENQPAFRAGDVSEIFSMQPTTFKQVLNDALRLGKKIGRTREAMEFVARRERRLQDLRSRLGLSKRSGSESRPSVLCISCIDPLVAAGNWVPDMVELAGGAMSDLGVAGQPSHFLGWTSVRRADPDVLAFVLSGLDLETTRSEVIMRIPALPGWADLRAVRNGRVYVFNGRDYFSRPGPRLYRGIELLALALHPQRLTPDFTAAEWEMEKIRIETTSEG